MNSSHDMKSVVVLDSDDDEIGEIIAEFAEEEKVKQELQLSSESEDEIEGLIEEFAAAEKDCCNENWKNPANVHVLSDDDDIMEAISEEFKYDITINISNSNSSISNPDIQENHCSKNNSVVDATNNTMVGDDEYTVSNKVKKIETIYSTSVEAKESSVSIQNSATNGCVSSLIVVPKFASENTVSKRENVTDKEVTTSTIVSESEPLVCTSSINSTCSTVSVSTGDFSKNKSKEHLSSESTNHVDQHLHDEINYLYKDSNNTNDESCKTEIEIHNSELINNHPEMVENLQCGDNKVISKEDNYTVNEISPVTEIENLDCHNVVATESRKSIVNNTNILVSEIDLMQSSDSDDSILNNVDISVSLNSTSHKRKITINVNEENSKTLSDVKDCLSASEDTFIPGSSEENNSKVIEEHPDQLQNTKCIMPNLSPISPTMKECTNSDPEMKIIKSNLADGKSTSSIQDSTSFSDAMEIVVDSKEINDSITKEPSLQNKVVNITSTLVTNSVENSNANIENTSPIKDPVNQIKSSCAVDINDNIILTVNSVGSNSLIDADHGGAGNSIMSESSEIPMLSVCESVIVNTTEKNTIAPDKNPSRIFENKAKEIVDLDISTDTTVLPVCENVIVNTSEEDSISPKRNLTSVIQNETIKITELEGPSNTELLQLEGIKECVTIKEIQESVAAVGQMSNIADNGGTNTTISEVSENDALHLLIKNKRRLKTAEEEFNNKKLKKDSKIIEIYDENSSDASNDFALKNTDIEQLVSDVAVSDIKAVDKISQLIPWSSGEKIETTKKTLDRIALHVCGEIVKECYKKKYDEGKKEAKLLEKKIEKLTRDLENFRSQAKDFTISQKAAFSNQGFRKITTRTVAVSVKIFKESEILRSVKEREAKKKALIKVSNMNAKTVSTAVSNIDTLPVNESKILRSIKESEAPKKALLKVSNMSAKTVSATPAVSNIDTLPVNSSNISKENIAPVVLKNESYPADNSSSGKGSVPSTVVIKNEASMNNSSIEKESVPSTVVTKTKATVNYLPQVPSLCHISPVITSQAAPAIPKKIPPPNVIMDGNRLIPYLVPSKPVFLVPVTNSVSSANNVQITLQKENVQSGTMLNGAAMSNTTMRKDAQITNGASVVLSLDNFMKVFPQVKNANPSQQKRNPCTTSSMQPFIRGGIVNTMSQTSEINRQILSLPQPGNQHIRLLRIRNPDPGIVLNSAATSTTKVSAIPAARISKPFVSPSSNLLLFNHSQKNSPQTYSRYPPVHHQPVPLQNFTLTVSRPPAVSHHPVYPLLHSSKATQPTTSVFYRPPYINPRLDNMHQPTVPKQHSQSSSSSSQQSSTVSYQNLTSAEYYPRPLQQFSTSVQHHAIPVQNNSASFQYSTFPVPQHSTSIAHNSASLQHPTAPVQQNAVPVQQNAVPVQQNAAPVQQNAAPVQQNAAPVQQNAAPVQQNSATLQCPTTPSSIHRNPVSIPYLPSDAITDDILPKPEVKGSIKEDGSVVISWNLTSLDHHSKIAFYQIYSYQEQNLSEGPPIWKSVGDVASLDLPMACTLRHFEDGVRYYFTVRVVDVLKRCGPFSDPVCIHYQKKDSHSVIK